MVHPRPIWDVNLLVEFTRSSRYNHNIIDNMNKFIAIIGCPGSGKSTLTNLLEKELPAQRMPADLFQSNPFFELTIKNRERWSLTSDFWFLLKRFELNERVSDMLLKGNIVVDSGIPMSLVYAHSRLESGYFTEPEWDLYSSFHKALSAHEDRPHLIIYLTASVPFLLKRIKYRGRDFEIANYTSEYLESLNASLDRVTTFYKDKGTRVISVNAEEYDFLQNMADLDKLVDIIKNN